MLSKVSWGEFIKFLLIVTSLYYHFVAILYYRKELLAFARKLVKKRGAPISND
ncbi:MAG TPA: hypothetical protein VKR32_15820 [Puia sp.]|nr:hypothetical protein [Puia sp.]